MRRVEDWEYLLVEYAKAQLGRPFLWGETDCFALARGALQVILDADPLADVPSYGTANEAAAVMAAYPDLGTELERRGATRVPIGFAQQGDILLLPGNDGHGVPVFGFVADGHGRLISSSVGGVVDMVRLPAVATAWRF